MDFIDYPDSEMMMIDLASRIADEIEVCLNQQDSVSLAVPGGTTPGPIFDDLCAVDLDWSRVSVMLTDERWVPENSERSNTRLIKERLLTEHAAAATFVPLYVPASEPEEVLPEIETLLAPQMPISVAVLGMGADMHTASIFPGADRLDEALHGDALALPMRAPGAPEPRITLTAKALRSALTCHIVIIGDEKRDALERARHLRPEEAPIAAFLQGAYVHWARD